MSFKTLIAKIVNFIRAEAAHVKLGRLAAAVEHDYTVVVQAAERAYAAGSSEIEALAHKELLAIENSITAAQRRAAKLLSIGVLSHPAAARAAAVVITAPDAASAKAQEIATSVTGVNVAPAPAAADTVAAAPAA